MWRTLFVLGFTMFGAATTMAQTWTYGPGTGWGRRGAAMAYDTDRGRVVRFGGEGPASPGGTPVLFNDTWEYDGTTWMQGPAAPPALTPRTDVRMVYDDARAVMVLFGGATAIDSSTTDAATWEYDGSAWTPGEPAPCSMSARFGHAMAYDSTRERTVLAGGWDGWNTFSDTWEYDQSGWHAASALPFGLSYASMGYDPVRGRCVLFGGQDPSFAPRDQTWEYDGASWTLVSTTMHPSRRSAAMMAYDKDRGVFVLMGGLLASWDVGRDTWELLGGEWTCISTIVGDPTEDAGVAYDAARRKIVAHGGGHYNSGTREYANGYPMAPAILPSGLAGTSYSVTFTPGSYFDVATGSLPSGMTLSWAGILSGTPATPGAFNFIVEAWDNGLASSEACSLLIDCSSDPLIAPATLPGGTEGTAYEATLSATGGTPPYSFAVSKGRLTPGLALDAGGVLSGMPTGGAFDFTVVATDAGGCRGYQAYTLTTSCAAGDISPVTLPAATEAVTYSQTLTAGPGAGPYDLAITSGAMPPGLALACGVIGGSAQAAGSFTFTVTGTERAGCTASRTYTLDVVCGTIDTTPATLPAATRDQSYSLSLQGQGGHGPYTFAVTAGSPPAGISLATWGWLHGTPTALGSSSFTVTATDPSGCSGTHAYALQVACPVLTLSPATLPGATVGQSYGQTVTATLGVPPYAFDVLSGALPSGLSLSSAGVLSGTPIAPGSSSFSLRATDATGCTGSRAYSLSATCPAIALAPGTLPAGAPSEPYSQTLAASGGTPPYSFSITSGAMPSGLTLSAGGVISGTTTSTGTFAFTTTATDAYGCSGPRAYSLAIVCQAITLAPPALPNGIQTQPYSQTVIASSGTPPHAYTITSGSLPSGLNLSSGGTISGTPDVPGTSSFTVRATDANGCTGSRAYALAVDCPTVIVSPASLPNGVRQQYYSQTFSASGGTPGYSYAVVAGSIPPGLSLASAQLYGTPTTVGTWTFTIRATAAYGCSGTRDYTVTIACPSLTLTPISLPSGTQAQAYSQTVTASGGASPYSYSVTVGALPAGLALSAGGVLSGTPTLPGQSSFTVAATDATGCNGSRAYIVTIGCPTIFITPATLPDGSVGTSYSQSLSASGGTAPHTFSLQSGVLPAGLSLASSGGVTGTPTSAGVFTFWVRVVDANACSASKPYTVTMSCPALTVNPTTLPHAVRGQAYNQTLSASGGTSPHSFSSGSLPPGLTLTSGGVLSGTPTTAGTTTFTAVATDAYGCQGNRSYTFVVDCPAITVNPPTLPNGTQGVAYGQTLTASGGPTPFTFGVTGGSLPPGLALSSSGVLSGTPSASGAYSVTVTATDAQGCAGSRAYSITINCPTITLSPTSLPDGKRNQSYSQTITASGGTSPYAYSLASGALPPGITLSSGGVLSGTPTTAATYNFTVRATDSRGCTGTRAYSLRIKN
ncbi:MAG: Ig domain-containing protein [Acidobacteriota bacterium]